MSVSQVGYLTGILVTAVIVLGIAWDFYKEWMGKHER